MPVSDVSAEECVGVSAEGERGSSGEVSAASVEEDSDPMLQTVRPCLVVLFRLGGGMGMGSSLSLSTFFFSCWFCFGSSLSNFEHGCFFSLSTCCCCCCCGSNSSGLGCESIL